MKKHRSLLIFLVCAILLCAAMALCVSAVRPDESRTVREVYVNDELDGYQMPYVMYLPANYDETKSYPTLIFFHGAGERGNDNELQLFHCVDELYDSRQALMDEVIFILPQCPADEQWVSWPWTDGNYSTDEVPESKAMSTAMKILDKVTTDYACDTNRVYVMGISMGGYGTWDALVRYEPIFAAGVAMCGGGDASKADVLKEIPIWCIHGTADTAVQFAGTQGMYDAIIAAGGERITFEPIEDGTHHIWDDACIKGDIVDWMFAQNLTLRYPPETEPETEPETDPAPVTEELPAEDGGNAAGVIIAVAAVVVIAAVAAVVIVKKKK